jgi:sec-independent protein translocase protein TatA
MEILVIAGVALLLFGGKRLADIGGGLGQGIKAFQQGLREADADEKSAHKDAPAKDAHAKDG